MILIQTLPNSQLLVIPVDAPFAIGSVMHRAADVPDGHEGTFFNGHGWIPVKKIGMPSSFSFTIRVTAIPGWSPDQVEKTLNEAIKNHMRNGGHMPLLGVDVFQDPDDVTHQ